MPDTQMGTECGGMRLRSELGLRRGVDPVGEGNVTRESIGTIADGGTFLRSGTALQQP